MKPPFTSTQEMYNYAANQLMNQNLSPETVKNNLMDHGVTDADAEIVVQNMLVAMEKKRKEETASNNTGSSPTSVQQTHEAASTNTHGSFASVQEMYNYAANQMIVQKLSNPVVKQNLINQGVTNTEAEVVIKNMMDQIGKNKPAEVNTKRGEGRKMILIGVLIAGVGALLAGTNFKIAGDTYVFNYTIMAIGAILFFRGLFKMF